MPVARVDGRPAVAWEDLPVMLVGPAEGLPAVALEAAGRGAAVAASVVAAARTEVPAAVVATERPGNPQGNG